MVTEPTDIGVRRGTLAIRKPSPLLTQLNGKAPLDHFQPISSLIGGEPNTVPYFNKLTTPVLANLSSPTAASLLRVLAGTVYGKVGNAVTDFSADPTGMTGSTAQLQASFDAVGAGDFSGVHIPPTQYYTNPLTAPTKTGYLILGGGMANDADVGASLGTMLILQNSNAGLPILTMDGAGGIRIADLSFCGSASLSTITGAGSGIVWKNKTGSGISSGTSTLSRVACFYCVVGIDIGVTDGSHDINNCDTFGFQHCVWLSCTTAIRTNQSQNVLLSLDMPFFSECGVAFDLVKGGCVTVANLSTSDVGIVFKVTEGGVSNSINVTGGHLDNNGLSRTQLYVAAAASSPMIANFTGVMSNPNMLSVASGGPFVTVKAGHTVTLKGMSNMGSANGAIFKIDGGGRVVLDSCSIPATLAYVLDATSTLGTTGSYAVVNCIDEATGLPIPDYGTAQIATAHIPDLAITNAKIAAATIDLTAKVTGVLPIANGGTGNTLGNAEGWDHIIVSTADEVANNAQNQDHTQFQASVTAGKLYMVSMQFPALGNNAAGDFQFGFGLAAGTMTANGHIQVPSAANAGQNLYKNESGVNPLTVIAVGIPTANIPVGVTFTWAFTFDTTTTFKFQFGVNTLGSGRTATIPKGSIFRIKQVST